MILISPFFIFRRAKKHRATEDKEEEDNFFIRWRRYVIISNNKTNCLCNIATFLQLILKRHSHCGVWNANSTWTKLWSFLSRLGNFGLHIWAKYSHLDFYLYVCYIQFTFVTTSLRLLCLFYVCSRSQKCGKRGTMCFKFWTWAKFAPMFQGFPRFSYLSPCFPTFLLV